jgi:hypothetical protein
VTDVSRLISKDWESLGSEHGENQSLRYRQEALLSYSELGQYRVNNREQAKSSI